MLLQNYLHSRFSYVLELVVFVGVLSQPAFFTQMGYAPRRLLFLGIFLYLVIIKRYFFPTWRALGLTRRNFYPALISLLPSFIVILLSLFLIHLFVPSFLNLGLPPLSVKLLFLKSSFYLLVSVPVQELLFRSYLISRLKSLSLSHHWVVIISGSIFSLAHLPFNLPLLTLGTFLLGLILSSNFLKYGNLWVAILAHFILGLWFTLLSN